MPSNTFIVFVALVLFCMLASSMGRTLTEEEDQDKDDTGIQYHEIIDYVSTHEDPHQTHLRRKRWAHLGEKWRNPSTLTFTIKNSPKSLSRSASDRVLKRALKIWERANQNIRFREVESWNNADIEIQFKRMRSRSELGMESHRIRGGYIMSPAIITFNDRLSWTDKEKHSKRWHEEDLISTAIHEVGHALGLDHSNIRAAIMFATNQPNHGSTLHQDDIDGIISLYPTGRYILSIYS